MNVRVIAEVAIKAKATLLVYTGPLNSVDNSLRKTNL